MPAPARPLFMFWLLAVLFAGQFESTFHEGLIALNRNDLPLAESRLQAAADLEPHNAGVWLALAQTYWRLHKAPQAQTAARNAETWAADNAVVLHALSIFYSETADYASAAKLLQASIRRNPFEESYYFELAQLDLKLEKFAAALETLDAGRKKFDKSAQLELATGVAYYGLRRFPEAIDAFLRTIKLDGGIEQPYVFLGRMLDQAEDRLPPVTQAFAAFVKRSPENYQSSFLYAKALALGGDSHAAEALLRKSIAQNDSYWESHFELGVLLGRQRRFDDAAREVRRGAELNPSDPVPHYHLARIYDRMGKPAEAAAERDLHARLSTAGGQASGIK
jgi:tetratricopeptide (TPR) repeat protein